MNPQRLEKFMVAIVVFGGAGLLTLGYFSPVRSVKIFCAIMLIFAWYVAYDIIVSRD